jgi:hypothetical protein
MGGERSREEMDRPMVLVDVGKLDGAAVAAAGAVGKDGAPPEARQSVAAMSRLLEVIDCQLGEVLKAPAALSNSVDSLERWPLVVFVSSALVCLGFSVAFHLFGESCRDFEPRGPI